MKKYIRDLFTYFGIVTIVVIIWTLAESLLLGQTTYSKVDSMVAAILSALIYDKIKC